MKTIRIVLLVLIVIGIILICTQGLWVNPLVNFILQSEKSTKTSPATDNSSVIYNNTDYGFTFSLPADWKGYSIIKKVWNGNPLTNTTPEMGTTILIRNPNWTVSEHYEDIPIMVFTVAQWNSYVAGDFATSAAPFPASELARNNNYVFAIPPRWDYDFSQGFQEAENIISSKPLHPYNL